MRHVEDQIQAYLDGELDAATRASVLEHCAACPRCARELREATAVWNALGEAGPPPAPRSLWPAVRQRVTTPQMRWRTGALAWSACGATGAGILLGLWLGSLVPGRNGELASASLIEEGALWVEGAETTLDQLFLKIEGEEQEAGS